MEVIRRPPGDNWETWDGLFRGDLHAACIFMIAANVYLVLSLAQVPKYKWDPIYFRTSAVSSARARVSKLDLSLCHLQTASTVDMCPVSEVQATS